MGKHQVSAHVVSVCRVTSVCHAVTCCCLATGGPDPDFGPGCVSLYLRNGLKKKKKEKYNKGTSKRNQRGQLCGLFVVLGIVTMSACAGYLEELVQVQ